MTVLDQNNRIKCLTEFMDHASSSHIKGMGALMKEQMYDTVKYGDNSLEIYLESFRTNLFDMARTKFSDNDVINLIIIILMKRLVVN